MTPFAYSLVNAAIEKRTPKDLAKEVRELMDDVHCFDITEILDLIIDFIDSMSEDTFDFIGERLFLPAPKTWIEYEISGKRWALHLTQAERGRPIEITEITRAPEQPNIFRYGFIDPSTQLTTVTAKGYLRELTPEIMHTMEGKRRIICAAICMINTPRTFGRRQHMPNRTLEKKLLKLGAGKFPLHAWTTIKLEVTKPIDIDDGEPHEAHLTGRRALHFVKAHMRPSNGQIVYVRSHHRGDPALGIKRSRYEVTH